MSDVMLYGGPPTDSLDLDGLKNAIRRGEIDEITRVVPTEWARGVERPVWGARGKHRRALKAGPFWALLSAGLSLMFVCIILLATIGVYSWLRAHGG